MANAMVGFRAASRVTLRDNGDLEESMAGMSDGQSAGEYIVGWGAMVRRPLLSYAPVAAFSRSTRIVCWQVKLTNARLSRRPARGSLNVSDIEVLEVPAISSFSHANQLWWGEKNDASANKSMKALYNRLNKSLLPDKTIVPAFPGTAGCREEWLAVKQAIVDEYNSGTLPEEFLIVGKWPQETEGVQIWPGLKRIAKQLIKITSKPRLFLRRLWSHHPKVAPPNDPRCALCPAQVTPRCWMQRTTSLRSQTCPR